MKENSDLQIKKGNWLGSIMSGEEKSYSAEKPFKEKTF